MESTIAILTKSSKFGGHCVAGIDVNSGEWVRLVSDNSSKHGTLSDDNICYADGCICNPLDIVCVDVVRAAPFAHQSENYLIDSHKRWRKIRECLLAEILQVHPTDNFAYIYENTQPYIDGDTIKSIGYSLMLVSVSSLVIYKVRNSNNQQKTKASFIYNGQRYSNIAVTDPAYYAAQENVRYVRAYLVVSLPDAPWPDDHYYKFIAKIYHE